MLELLLPLYYHGSYVLEIIDEVGATYRNGIFKSDVMIRRPAKGAHRKLELQGGSSWDFVWLKFAAHAHMCLQRTLFW
jgi:hypothetical protein